MVEAGYDYSPDSLPDPSVWEQMLNKSPIKHVTQVLMKKPICYPSKTLLLYFHIPVIYAILHLGADTGAAYIRGRRQACTQQAGN